MIRSWRHLLSPSIMVREDRYLVAREEPSVGVWLLSSRRDWVSRERSWPDNWGPPRIHGLESGTLGKDPRIQQTGGAHDLRLEPGKEPCCLQRALKAPATFAHSSKTLKNIPPTAVSLLWLPRSHGK